MRGIGESARAKAEDVGRFCGGRESLAGTGEGSTSVVTFAVQKDNKTVKRVLSLEIRLSRRVPAMHLRLRYGHCT